MLRNIFDGGCFVLWRVILIIPLHGTVGRSHHVDRSLMGVLVVASKIAAVLKFQYIS